MTSDIIAYVVIFVFITLLFVVKDFYAAKAAERDVLKKEPKALLMCDKGEIGHNFVAIYEEAPRPGNTTVAPFTNPKDARAIMFYNVYKYHICTRCGKIVKEETK